MTKKELYQYNLLTAKASNGYKPLTFGEERRLNELGNMKVEALKNGEIEPFVPAHKLIMPKSKLLKHRYK